MSNEITQKILKVFIFSLVMDLSNSCSKNNQQPLATKNVQAVFHVINNVDLLFVIDNSSGTAEKQDNLISNAYRLFQKLDQYHLDYRVGVISTDLGAGDSTFNCEKPGDEGKLHYPLKIPTCSPLKQPWIEKGSNVSENDINSAFRCIASLGAGGCGFEQILEASRRALDPKLNLNPDFLRPDAAFAVIFLTDEDDCSAEKINLFDPNNDKLGPLDSFRCFEFGIECDVNDRSILGPRKNCKPAYDWLFPIEDYVSFFKNLKPSGRFLAFAIAGPTNHVEVELNSSGESSLKTSCQTGSGKALPAIRLKAFVEAFGHRGHFNEARDQKGQRISLDACSDSYGPSLSYLGDLVSKQIRFSWCLPFKPMIMNATTHKIYADCSVISSKTDKLQACQDTSIDPCFKLELSSACIESNVALIVENAIDNNIGDEVSVSCLVIDS